MRILFLTSSLEPGRDGVGDYVRLLAGACARLGNACATVALNDPCVTEPLESLPEAGSETIPLLRLPAGMPWARRMELARAFRASFRPDWISFHLVSYGFHPRGILLGLGPVFRALTEGAPLHLMFHELWLGGGAPTPFRHRVTGVAQRFGLGRLLALLRPRLVTTSNPVYAGMLRSLRVEAGVLPLFGNIPVANPDAASSAYTALAKTGIAPENRGAWWLGLFFGGLHEEWKPEPFLGLLLRAAKRTGKRVCLVSAGRMGAAGEAIWGRLKTGHTRRIEFLNLGEQPAETISALLHLADFGIAASPWQLIGKSGAAAAMLDHGLPVIVTRDDFQPDLPPTQPPSTDPLFHLCDAGLEAKLAAGLSKRPPLARVDEIAADLCHRLQAASSSAP